MLVVGVLLLQLGFIYSYVGAFHQPTPHRVSIAVVAPGQSSSTVQRLNGLPSAPLRAHAVTDEAAAGAEIADGTTAAALIVNLSSKTDTLLITSAGGVSVASASTS